MTGTNVIPGLTSPEENERRRMHDDQDYTVIIKWKNWFAFEDEEMDIPLERKRKHTGDMIIIDDQDAKDQRELKKMKLSDAMLEDKRLLPMSSTVLINESFTQQPKQMEHNMGQHNQCDLNDESTFTQMVKPCGYIMSSEVSEEKLVNKVVSSEQKLAVSKSPSNKPAACGSEGFKCSAIISEFTPRKSAQVHDTSIDDDTGVTGPDVHFSTKKAENRLLEEAHDADVTLNGKMKMSDIRTLYKKSISGNVHGKPTFDCMENHGLIEHERPAKRMREAVSATHAERGAVVKCPICQLTIPGDMNDANFNAQINLHVDSCMRAAI